MVQLIDGILAETPIGLIKTDREGLAEVDGVELDLSRGLVEGRVAELVSSRQPPRKHRVGATLPALLAGLRRRRRRRISVFRLISEGTCGKQGAGENQSSEPG